MQSVTVLNLVSDSLREIGVLAGGQPLSAEDGEFAVTRLNQLFDNYNAMKEASFVERFDTFTFIASQQDYTIGPAASSPDFALLNARPDSILAANVILDNVSPDVRNPIVVRDYQWWASVSVRAVTSTFPTDVYYEPDWPLGILHFWPKPTSTYGLELVTSNTFAQVALADTLNLPSGYQNAIMLTLAEDLAPAFGRSPNGTTTTKAREARARIFSVNEFVPRLQTQDAGMPSNTRNRATFLYRTGLDSSVNR